MSLGKSDPPPPPDYTAAARAQGGANVQSAIATALLNRPREVTPYGTRDWSQIGTMTVPGAEGNAAVELPQYQSSINLTPLGQQRFDQEQRITNQIGNVAESGIGRVQDTFAKPFSFSGADDLQNQAESAYMSRMAPQFQRNRESLKGQLAMQGIDPGGEAADREYERIAFQENDAKTNAVLNAFKMRPQMLQEDLAIRNQPLNEINALRSGSQVNVPQFQNYSPTSVTAAPMFGAAQAQGNADMQGYNAQTAQQSALMGGLFSLGGAAMGAPIPTGGTKPWWMGG
jgi:hypothetical protein